MIGIKSKLWILAFACFTVANGYAQKQVDIWAEIDSLELKPYQIKKLGKQADKVGDTYSAIDYYTKYNEVKPQKQRYMYLIAELYREARDYQSALEWYQKVYDEVPEKFPLAMYRVAEMEIMANGNYNAAKDSLLSFKKLYKVEAKDPIIKKLLAAQVEGCEMAEDLIGHPLEVLITHLDTTINTAHVEFSPLVINDTTLLYSALKSREINFYTTDKEDSTYGKQPTRQMYVANKNFDDWTGQKMFEGPFNTAGVETGHGTFSPDKQRFYFTRCIPDNKSVICSIYISRIDSTGNWTEPEALPEHINTPEFTTTQPTIATHPKYNLDIIYYVSNRDDGKGGLDVWYTYVRDKKGVLEYQKPKNCGKSINTVGDDVTPFFDDETKKLYFSSNGLPGLGGLDIFSVQGQMNKWSDPVNVGYPINSKEDDLDYTRAPNQQEGFFVSNRPGGTSLKSETCCDDIYHFYYTQYIKIFVNGQLYEFVDTIQSEFKVLDKFTVDSVGIIADSIAFDTTRIVTNTKPAEEIKLNNATITLFLVDTATKERIEIKKAFTNDEGQYIMKLEQGNQYVLQMSKDGYFKQDMLFSTADISKSDTIELNAMWLKKIPEEPIIIKNVYYPFDKDHLTPETKVVIDTTIYQILLENPEIVVEISSHTDSKGSDSYNENLSQRRAESVVKYLITKGIAKERLVAKGYGESHPIAPNENEDGTDSEEGRAKNRRTEFRVIGVIEDATGVIYEE